MNAKKAKAIRRYVRATGAVLKAFPLHHVSLGRKLVSADHLTSGFGGIITARYPDSSYQRIYRAAKRGFKRVNVGFIDGVGARLRMADSTPAF